MLMQNGMVFIVDCSSTDLAITTRFGIADVKRGIMMWKDAFPCKCKKVFLNAESVFCILYVERKCKNNI